MAISIIGHSPFMILVHVLLTLLFVERMGNQEHSLPSPRLGQSPFCCAACLDTIRNPDDDVVVGNAYDLVVVQSDKGYFFHQSFTVTFPKTITHEYKLILEVGTSDLSSDEILARASWDSMVNVTSSGNKSNNGRVFDVDIDGPTGGSIRATDLGHALCPGRNPVRYLLLHNGAVVGVALANIYLWSASDKVIVSDIDGTITCSNAGGIYDTILTENYSHCHDDICELLSSLVVDDDVHIVYVTSRPVSLASTTRKFLHNLRQDNHRLPDGPILGFGGNMRQLVVMELISRQTHHFKAEILWKNVVQPFQKTGQSRSVLVAAFGNTLMDVQAYNMVNVPLSGTFFIENSRVYSFEKHREEELQLLTTTLTTTNVPWGSPKPREWFRSNFNCSFQGYGDPLLREHLSMGTSDD
eukprot:Nitzschia sp. Nitz4//scaffold110_size71422//49998//51233//NITZ4_005879-RA/size71422-processed-gene-0.24-mRNA-1//-1//CDS//3329533104//2820//frame0